MTNGIRQRPHLPGHLLQRGGDLDLVRAELLHVIEDRISAHPRSHQAEIGPSELGCACQRRLGYRLAGVRKVNDGPSWRPTVGVAVHSWLEEAFANDNRIGPDRDSRWWVETRLDVGEINGRTVTGKCDLYDEITATSIDHKIVGVTTLRSARSNGPSAQYRAQAHLYGRGWARLGLAIDTVAVLYLPSNGNLTDAYFWHEAYQEQVALDALANVSTVVNVLTAFGPERALPVLRTAEVYCRACPWFLPAATDVTEACPGHRET